MSIAIGATKLWLERVIIEFNFCPFAKKEFVNNTIAYIESDKIKIVDALEELIMQCYKMREQEEIETSLVIFPKSFQNFDHFLDLVDYANDLIADSGMEGEFQLATFHPHYCFEGEARDDASNYTNRAPFPILHIIREQSLERVLAVYPEPETIPENNIALAREKGSDYFKSLMMAIKQDAKK